MISEQLIDAIRNSDEDKFQELVSSMSLEDLSSTNTIHYTNWFPGIGFTYLQLVCMVRPTFAKHIVERGADVDLHSACSLNDRRTILQILERDKNSINESIDGFYPIHFTIQQPDSLRLLLEHDDNPNRNIQKLAWYDWEVSAANKGVTSYRPMHMVAVGRGTIAFAACLKEFGADISSYSSPFGEAPIHLAATYNRDFLIEWFVENGCAIDIPTKPRHTGIAVNELFEEHYFSPFEKSYNKTALMLACGEGQQKAVKKLIALGSNLNAVDSEGYTPLHYACGAFWEPNTDIVKLVLAAGAEKERQSLSGILPRDLAESKHYQEIVDVLS